MTNVNVTTVNNKDSIKAYGEVSSEGVIYTVSINDKIIFSAQAAENIPSYKSLLEYVRLCRKVLTSNGMTEDNYTSLYNKISNLS